MLFLISLEYVRKSVFGLTRDDNKLVWYSDRKSLHISILSVEILLWREKFDNFKQLRLNTDIVFVSEVWTTVLKHCAGYDSIYCERLDEVYWKLRRFWIRTWITTIKIGDMKRRVIIKVDIDDTAVTNARQHRTIDRYMQTVFGKS